MMQAETREKALIGLLFVLMLLKGAAWSIAFPLWQGPDEDDHYAVIQFVGELGRLPDVGDEVLPDEVALSRILADVGRLPYEPEQRQGFGSTAVTRGETELAQLPASTRTSFDLKAVGKLMHATPLYYLLAAPVYRLTAQSDLLTRAAAQRFLAVLWSSPIVILAYLITRELFPHQAAMRLTIPFLVAFHPMITEITAVTSVDGLFFVIYTLLIYLTIRVLRTQFDWRYGIAMGASFAAGMLIKPTLNAYAPIIALLVAYDWWRGSGRRWQVVAAALVMTAVLLPPVGWWMARSWRLNHDLFYFNPVVKGHRIIQHPFYDYTVWQHFLDYYQSVWGGLFVTWWAHFGWIDTPLPPWVYHFLRGLTFAAILGLLVRLWQMRTKPLSSQFWRQQADGLASSSVSIAPPVVWLFLALSILLPVLLIQVYDLTFWWQYGNGRGLQGRYWLGTVVPMLIFWVAGLLCLVPRRWHPSVHTALRLGMVALNFASLFGYILPRYYL